MYVVIDVAFQTSVPVDELMDQHPERQGRISRPGVEVIRVHLYKV